VKSWQKGAVLGGIKNNFFLFSALAFFFLYFLGAIVSNTTLRFDMVLEWFAVFVGVGVVLQMLWDKKGQIVKMNEIRLSLLIQIVFAILIVITLFVLFPLKSEPCPSWDSYGCGMGGSI
jgi:hypothetical protein